LFYAILEPHSDRNQEQKIRRHRGWESKPTPLQYEIWGFLPWDRLRTVASGFRRPNLSALTVSASAEDQLVE